MAMFPVEGFSNKALIESLIEKGKDLDEIYASIDRSLNDMYDPRALPGYDTGFSAFYKYCLDFDKMEAEPPFIPWLKKYPERFWYFVRTHQHLPERLHKRQELAHEPYKARALQAVAANIGSDYFGAEVKLISSTELWPEHGFILTMLTRYVNAYAEVKGWPEIVSRPRPLNFCTCPSCGAKFNIKHNIVINPDDDNYKTEDHEMYAFVREHISMLEKQQEEERRERRRQKEIEKLNKELERAQIAYERTKEREIKREVKMGERLNRFKLRLSNLTKDSYTDTLNALALMHENKPRVLRSLELLRDDLKWYYETN